MRLPEILLLLRWEPIATLVRWKAKEIRFGSASSGYWSIATTVISTGSVNSMHDSTMPLSGMNELLAMMINCFMEVVVLEFLITSSSLFWQYLSAG